MSPSIREWIVRLLAVGRRDSRDRDLEDELRFHLDALAEAHERSGLAPDAARRAAERDLGGVDRTRQAWRDQRSWLPLEELLQDARYGLRVLRRAPVVAVLAVLTLGIAVAATTSVFSVVDAVLLAPLPYPHGGRLVVLTEYYKPMHADGVSVTSGNFLEWRDRSRSFAALTAIGRSQRNLTGESEPRQVSVAAVSDGFPATVGVQPALGRMFAREEFTPGRDRVALIGHALWTSRFGADPDAVGRAVTMDDQPYTVIGVMPPGFLFPEPGYDLWVPMPLTAADRQNRSGHMLLAVGRLKPGVNVAAASRELHGIAAALGTQYPSSNRDWDVSVQLARDALVGDTANVLLAVMGAVALLLLVACANVAGLLLTRGFARGRELAIRTALGAGRVRLVRQLLTESVLLALAAGAVGLALAWAIQPLAAALRPPDLLTWKPIAVDARALVFALATTMAAGITFGTLPAVVASRADFGTLASTRAAGRGASHLRQGLIAFEVALALTLVVGAALLGEALTRLTAIDPGFEPAGVVTMTVSLPEGRYPSDPSVDAFYDRLFERLRALPGVRASGATTALPLSGSTSVRPYRIVGGPSGDDRPIAHYRIIMPGYFEAMRIPVRAGRTFDVRDTAERPLVAIINEKLAREAWGRRSAVGQRITVGGSNDLWGVVVGVIADVRHFGPGSDAPAEMYWPAAQIDAMEGATLRKLRRNMTLVVSAAGDPMTVVPAVRRTVAGIDPEQPIASVRTMTSLMSASLSLVRGGAWLVSIICVTTVLFALLGVFGAAAHNVVQRRRELAVRIALGAGPRSVARLVVRSALNGALVGIGGGVALALGLGKAFAALIAGVRPPGMLTFAAAAVAVAAAALAACWLPARRASRIDPMKTLRTE
jgi:predicted permease